MPTDDATAPLTVPLSVSTPQSPLAPMTTAATIKAKHGAFEENSAMFLRCWAIITEEAAGRRLAEEYDAAQDRGDGALLRASRSLWMATT